MRALFVRSRRGGWIREDGTIRSWHPGYWWCAVKALARAVGLLAHHCPTCNGHGRVVRPRYLRRSRCRTCHGTGRRKG